jgi:hypothetical protein
MLGDFLRGTPQVLVDQVAVQVHRHRGGGMSEDALNDLRVGPGTEPHRRGRVPEVVHSKPWHADSLGRSTPPNRALPVGLAKRTPAWCAEHPIVGGLVACPAINDRGDVVNERDGSSALVLERVHEQLATLTAQEDSSLKPQPTAWHMDQVANLQPGQLTPPQAAHTENQDQLAVRTMAGGGQVFQLPNG